MKIKSIIKLFVIMLTPALFSCSANDCNKIPTKFKSYDDAIRIIKKSSFTFKDSVIVTKSLIMVSANYFSCDEQIGFFLFTRNTGSQYFSSKVPITIWNNFKNSDLKDSFYLNNIKDKYTTDFIGVDRGKK